MTGTALTEEDTLKKLIVIGLFALVSLAGALYLWTQAQ